MVVSMRGTNFHLVFFKYEHATKGKVIRTLRIKRRWTGGNSPLLRECL
jgi:hypothetical protein